MLAGWEWMGGGGRGGTEGEGEGEFRADSTLSVALRCHAPSHNRDHDLI